MQPPQNYVETKDQKRRSSIISNSLPAVRGVAVPSTSNQSRISYRNYNYTTTIAQAPPSPPKAVFNILRGGPTTLIAPNSSLARAIVMGNHESTTTHGDRAREDSSDRNRTNNDITIASYVGHSSTNSTLTPLNAVTTSSTKNQQQLYIVSGQQQPKKPISNLPALLNDHGRHVAVDSSTMSKPALHHRSVSEADSASGPAPSPSIPPSSLEISTQQLGVLGRSAPNYFAPVNFYRDERQQNELGQSYYTFTAGGAPPAQLTRQLHSSTAAIQLTSNKVRRCMSSKELGTLAPPSGSPYAALLSRKQEIEVATRNKLHELRRAEAHQQWTREVPHGSDGNVPTTDSNDCSLSGSARSQQHECANEVRNRRRAEHAKAVVDDLCDVVADLFIAESKLLDPRNYGVAPSEDQSKNVSRLDRDQILQTIHSFVSSLPVRYALGADTPSEVLLHMRLMAAARSDNTKAALHIHNLDNDNNSWTRAATTASSNSNPPQQSGEGSLRLVTISCHDCTGLLEYISRLLASSGSRVLDADVMLSTDGIVLDRFVVQMTGRLRLATMVNLIENFLREASALGGKKDDNSPVALGKVGSPKPLHVVPEAGPLYFKASDMSATRNSVEQEILEAIPLSTILSSSSDGNLDHIHFPKLRKMHSLPSAPSSSLSTHSILSARLQIRNSPTTIPLEVYTSAEPRAPPQSLRERRPLVNRPAVSDLDRDGVESVDDFNKIDYVTVPSNVVPEGTVPETRVVPLIPFDELMLIESIGTGRVSTIYRAAWRRNQSADTFAASGAVQMVALKVAMVNPTTGDTSHVDELRREADIAARLQHQNICDLVGVAADQECFCLAYEFCEGGSLLSLLSDHSRFYEYLPIALDIAQGMAFLHKKSIIHRDLKPANILLTRDHRAKIADFGMSINNHGQELTAETGTYRYMAPEVIRHESYSSNADVYSFGICLWQLITREIPFATMTPIQAAYAVAEGHRPEIPKSTPLRLQEIIRSCWDHDSQRRPSFTYVAMALADYVKMAFSPANVGTLTLQIANEMLATVEGNSTVNVDFSTPVAGPQPTSLYRSKNNATPPPPPTANYFNLDYSINDSSGNLGLEIE